MSQTPAKRSFWSVASSQLLTTHGEALAKAAERTF